MGPAANEIQNALESLEKQIDDLLQQQKFMVIEKRKHDFIRNKRKLDYLCSTRTSLECALRTIVGE